MRGLLQRLNGPRPAPLPTRHTQMAQGAFHALCDVHELARESLTGETTAPPESVLLEIDSITGQALLEMHSLARLGR
jgi:hypothetical protein